jgi:hypothetical protein
MRRANKNAKRKTIGCQDAAGSSIVLESYSCPTNIFTLILHVKRFPFLLSEVGISEEAQRLCEHRDGHAKSGDAWLPSLHPTAQYNIAYTLRRPHGSSGIVAGSSNKI